MNVRGRLFDALYFNASANIICYGCDVDIMTVMLVMLLLMAWKKDSKSDLLSLPLTEL